MKIQANKPGTPAAFTLVEVVIAVGIFFMAMFAILGVFTAGLHSASLLARSGPTAGMVAAEISVTNQLEEGSDSGDFSDVYPGYRWTREISIYGTNGLFQVDCAVYKGENLDSKLSIILFKPESASKLGTTKFGR